jgi:hypothetical protein
MISISPCKGSRGRAKLAIPSEVPSPSVSIGINLTMCGHCEKELCDDDAIHFFHQFLRIICFLVHLGYPSHRNGLLRSARNDTFLKLMSILGEVFCAQCTKYRVTKKQRKKLQSNFSVIEALSYTVHHLNLKPDWLFIIFHLYDFSK